MVAHKTSMWTQLLKIIPICTVGTKTAKENAKSVHSAQLSD